MKAADIGGFHGADAFEFPSRVIRQRMMHAVYEMSGCTEKIPRGIIQAARHLVIDRALFLEAQRLVGIRRYSEVTYFAPDLFIAVIGIEKRIELGVEKSEEDIGAGIRVERIGCPPLLRECRRLRQPHCAEARKAATRLAFPDKEMLLGVRFPLVGNRKRPYIRECLRY